MFNKNVPYDWDLPLFAELKLKPFDAKTWEETFVGDIKIEDGEGGNVKLFVTCVPAQFWKAEISWDDRSDKLLLETGSGSLKDYWPTIKDLASRMVLVDKI